MLQTAVAGAAGVAGGVSGAVGKEALCVWFVGMREIVRSTTVAAAGDKLIGYGLAVS